MAKFNIPEIPKELTESYWSKRELLARKVKTGVSAAIEEFKQAYKKAPWKNFETLYGVQIPDKLGSFGECQTIGKAINALETQFKQLMKEVQSGDIYKLKLAAWNLRDTAKKASAELAKEKKYPKAASLAADISKTADFYAVSINANTLDGYMTKAYFEILTPLDRKIRTAIGFGSHIGSADAVLKSLQNFRSEPDAEERAKLVAKFVNDGSSAGTMRSVNQNLGARIKAAYSGCGYPALSQAVRIWEQNRKWASSPPPVNSRNVDDAIDEIEALAKASKNIPDNVKYLTER